MTDYRQAKCIELHDSNIALTTNDESYNFTSLTGRYIETDKPVFCINLADIAMLGEVFNIKTSKTCNVSISSEQAANGPGKNEDINILEIPVYKKYFSPSDEIEGDRKITKLSCQIISERLINIKIISKNEKVPNHLLKT